MKPLALVIEDDDYWQQQIRQRLEPQFEVLSEVTGESGLETMRDRRPALVVLDAWLKRSPMQGFEVLARVKAEEALSRTPVLMLTNTEEPADAFRWKADEYVRKSEFDTQFEARIEQLLTRAALWPFDSFDEPTLSLYLRANRLPIDMVVGVIEYREQTAGVLDLEFDRYAAQGRNAFDGKWRDHARDIGESLNEKLMAHSEIAVAIERAVQRFRRVNVAGAKELLDVPLEFLRAKKLREYFVLHYPFSRSVLDVHPGRGYAPSLSPKLLNDLHRRGLPLRVLLIAADTGGVPRVEHEVAEIQRIFEHNPKQLRTVVKLLRGGDATSDAVAAELQQPYHIVHFAGHGQFVRQRSDDHRLMLHGTRDLGRAESLSAPDLKLLWGENRPSLFYMSACRSADGGDKSDLYNNDLLGLTDAAIAAGVPTVIGFRWPVTDTGAYHVATAFYSDLMRTGRPDHALRSARRKVALKHRDDPAWLSPVLVMQSP